MRKLYQGLPAASFAGWRTLLQPRGQGKRTQCHQKAPVNAVEETSVENIKLSTVTAGRLEQRHSVCYRGVLQLGSHREHPATDTIASNPQTSKAKHQLRLSMSIFPHTGFWGWVFLFGFFSRSFCPLRQPQYRLYSRYLHGSLSGCYGVSNTFWSI